MAELILALDVEDRGPALRLLEALPEVRWVKIGSVLFTASGPALVDEIRRGGRFVFLDLKWHDIPATVRGAVRRARSLEVSMITVHAMGGAAMIQAAREAAGPDLRVVAVTVLTSHTSEAFGVAVGRQSPDLAQEVERLARMACASGADGVVCSPLEVGVLRRALGPEPLLVTPGIRRPGDSPGDQSRVATAAQAVRGGATHLVVGRPILEAADPAATWRELQAEIAR